MQSQRTTSPSNGDNEEPKLHPLVHLFLSMPHLIFCFRVIFIHLSIYLSIIYLCIYLSILLSIASTFIKNTTYSTLLYLRLMYYNYNLN